MIQRKTLDIIMQSVPRRLWGALNAQVLSPEGFIVAEEYIEYPKPDKDGEPVTRRYRAKILAFCFRKNGVTVEFEVIHGGKPDKEILLLKEKVATILTGLINSSTHV